MMNTKEEAMCEFCGCAKEGSERRPLQQRKQRGKALGVRIVAVPVDVKARQPDTTGSREEMRPAFERVIDEYLPSTEA